MALYAQRAFELDSEFPLTCVTWGNYFLPRQDLEAAESVAQKALEMADVNAIASDSWYLLARKEHYQESPNWSKVDHLYSQADDARGGNDRGLIPAVFGSVQAQVRKNEPNTINDAKNRLEKMIQHGNVPEAKVLLGILYSQDVFKNQTEGSKEDKPVELKKAVAYLEAVRLAWKDVKKAITPDINVLMTLARLHEVDQQPEKSLQCLSQALQIALDQTDEDHLYLDIKDEDERKRKKMGHLPPQLLNNIACFQFQLERFAEATETFQMALSACMNRSESENNTESDQLVTTISYNLARSFEGSGLLDEAKAVYESLLIRHPDYTDARTRVAYIELRQNPTSEGPKAMSALFEAESHNLEVRALYGWYLGKAKRRTTNILEDQEQRHYKHTLQQHDKHDLYSLTGMGNLYLTLAREMRRDTEQDKEKRRKNYERSVEFFFKALQLDPTNAYAAQGFAIAMVEDKKDFPAAVSIFSRIKDTIKESSVLINLGHVYGELKQYGRAIESVS